ncbi:MAG: hypothetical protein ACPGQS_05415 [Bradymonadia bacterium]
MTSEPNLPIIELDDPSHVRAYAGPYLRTDREGREVIWATPRYFLISPEIDRAALVKALNKVSKIRTAFYWTFSIVCVTLIWLDFKSLNINISEWILLASVLLADLQSRWLDARLRKTLHPYTDYLTEVSIKYSWRDVLSDTIKVFGTILLVITTMSFLST